MNLDTFTDTITHTVIEFIEQQQGKQDPDIEAFVALAEHQRRVWKIEQRRPLIHYFGDALLALPPNGPEGAALTELRGGLVRVLLVTVTGLPIQEVDMPPFKHMPEVIRWGYRAFQRDDGVSHLIVTYRECLMWSAPDVSL